MTQLSASVARRDNESWISMARRRNDASGGENKSDTSERTDSEPQALVSNDWEAGASRRIARSSSASPKTCRHIGTNVPVRSDGFRGEVRREAGRRPAPGLRVASGIHRYQALRAGAGV